MQIIAKSHAEFRVWILKRLVQWVTLLGWWSQLHCSVVTTSVGIRSEHFALQLMCFALHWGRSWSCWLVHWGQIVQAESIHASLQSADSHVEGPAWKAEVGIGWWSTYNQLSAQQRTNCGHSQSLAIDSSSSNSSCSRWRWRIQKFSIWDTD